MRYAKEDQNALWGKGGSVMQAINGYNCAPEFEFREFWTPGQIPMRICTNSQMSKIFGYSFNDKEGVLTIVDYKRPSQFQSKNIRVPNNEKWVGLETTT